MLRTLSIATKYGYLVEIFSADIYTALKGLDH